MFTTRCVRRVAGIVAGGAEQASVGEPGVRHVLTATGWGALSSVKFDSPWPGTTVPAGRTVSAVVAKPVGETAAAQSPPRVSRTSLRNAATAAVTVPSRWIVMLLPLVRSICRAVIGSTAASGVGQA